MIIQGQVRNPNTSVATDGVSYDALQGKQGELIVSDLHGKYFTQSYRGNLFVMNVTATAIPVTTTTAPTFALWNPQGNMKLANIVKLSLGYVVTTSTAGNILWSYQLGVGANVGTAAPITAYAAGTATNLNIGSGVVTTMKPGIATITLTAAGTVLRATGFSQLVTTPATAYLPWVTWNDEPDGTLIVPPGCIIYLTASVATASTYTCSMVWEEVPL